MFTQRECSCVSEWSFSCATRCIHRLANNTHSATKCVRHNMWCMWGSFVECIAIARTAYKWVANNLEIYYIFFSRWRVLSTPFGCRHFLFILIVISQHLSSNYFSCREYCIWRLCLYGAWMWLSACICAEIQSLTLRSEPLFYYLFICDGMWRHTSAHRFNFGSDDVGDMMYWQWEIVRGIFSRYFIVRLRVRMKI